MSGSGGWRSDSPPGAADSSSGGGQLTDHCLKVRRGPINSPKSEILSLLKVGDVLRVQVHTIGTRPVLVVVDNNGSVAGSLTFSGYLELIGCIQNRHFSYRAVLIKISSGVYEVRVEPD